MQLFTADQARSALSVFDEWVNRSAIRAEITSADVALAGLFLRRLDLPLRTLDAVHIASAQRLHATLVAFDQRMSDSARALGIAVAVP
jgi:predicted nucleic acid-binding protein